MKVVDSTRACKVRASSACAYFNYIMYVAKALRLRARLTQGTKSDSRKVHARFTQDSRPYACVGRDTLRSYADVIWPQHARKHMNFELSSAGPMFCGPRGSKILIRQRRLHGVFMYVDHHRAIVWL